MENQNKYYKTTDLKLYSFLRTISPELFIGINKNPNNKVDFLFKYSQKLENFTEKYWRGDCFNISPLQIGINMDLGKNLIFKY